MAVLIMAQLFSRAAKHAAKVETLQRNNLFLPNTLFALLLRHVLPHSSRDRPSTRGLWIERETLLKPLEGKMGDKNCMGRQKKKKRR